MNAQELIQERLRQRLLEAKLKNPRTSIRSFAKMLKMQSGTVSLVLLGKRKVSHKLALKLASALTFDPIEHARIEQEFSEGKKTRKKVSRSGAQSTNAQSKRLADKFKPEHLRLSADQFHVLKDWHNFAILNLIFNDNYVHDPKWISERLSISEATAAESLERLTRLGLIYTDTKGRVQRKHPKLNTSDEVKSLSLRYSHYQALDLAKTALDTLEVDERDFTWLTLPIDFSQMLEMKVMIREFQDQFINRFGEIKGSNEVARLCVQLFPLTNVKQNKQEKK